MRKLKPPFLAVIVMLFNVSLLLATPHPPAPTARQANTTSSLDEEPCEFCETEPVPIDENIIFLALGGLLLGATVIYKNKIKKASV